MFRKDLLLALGLFLFGVVGGVAYNFYLVEKTDSGTNGSRETASSRGETSDLGAPDALLPAVATGDDSEHESQLQQIARTLKKDTGGSRSKLNSLATRVSKGDRFLLAGNYHNSYALYAQAQRQFGDHTPAEILFRLGLTSELSGQFESAKGYYTAAIRESTRNANTRALSYIGLARINCLLEEVHFAEEILSDLFLRLESESSVPNEIEFQLKMQLAWIAKLRYLEEIPEVRRIQLEFFENDLNLEATLDAVDLYDEIASSEQETQNLESAIEDLANPENSKSDTEPAIRMLQRPSDDAAMIAFSAHTTTIPIRDALSQLAAITDLKFELSTNAEAMIRGRSTKLDVTGVSLALLLDNLVKPLGVAWMQAGNTIQFSDLRHTPNVEQFYLASAIRAQRVLALDNAPNDRRLGALLALGNLNLISQDYEQASLFYQQLGQLNPNGELLAKLTFNNAMLEYLLGRDESAARMFYASIDQTLDFELQSICYLRLSELQLENDQINQAIKSSSRSLTLAGQEKIRRLAVLTLARGYLLSNDPFSANRVLFENSELLESPEQRKLGQLLGSFARYLGTTDKISQAKARSRLIIALANIENSDLPTVFDKIIGSRAFFEIGFKQRSTQLLQLAQNDNSVDSWKRKILYQMASQQLDDAEELATVEILSKLARDASDDVGAKATLRLARIELEKGESKKCLQRCREMISASTETEVKREALSLMGAAYRKMGHHMSAAVCYSGMAPEMMPDEAEEAESVPENYQ